MRETDAEGYDVATYRLTLDSGAVKDELNAEEGTKEVKKDISITKEPQTLVVTFAEVGEESENEKATEETAEKETVEVVEESGEENKEATEEVAEAESGEDAMLLRFFLLAF